MASKSSLENFRKEVSQKVVATGTRHLQMPFATIPVVIFLLVAAWVGIYGKPVDIPTSTVSATAYVPSEALTPTGSEAIIQSGIKAGKKLAAPTNAAPGFNDFQNVVFRGREAEVETFVTRFKIVAQTEQQKFGIPASISLAQGLLESDAGTSRLARQAKNFFGIKCFGKRCSKGHCINAHDDHHKDFFRKYPSAWESWRAHSLLLVNGDRYNRLFRLDQRDYKSWAYGLQSAGYATSKTYGEKLVSIIETYGLHKYDK